MTECLFFLFVFVFVLVVVAVAPVQRDYRVTRVQHYTKDGLCFQCRNTYLMVEGKVDGIFVGFTQ